MGATMWIKEVKGSGQYAGRINLDCISRFSVEYVNPGGYYAVAHMLSVQGFGNTQGGSEQIRVSDYFSDGSDAVAVIDNLLLNGS